MTRKTIGRHCMRKPPSASISMQSATPTMWYENHVSFILSVRVCMRPGIGIWDPSTLDMNLVIYLCDVSSEASKWPHTVHHSTLEFSSFSSSTSSSYFPFSQTIQVELEIPRGRVSKVGCDIIRNTGVAATTSKVFNTKK